jgi:hypothetical protein
MMSEPTVDHLSMRGGPLPHEVAAIVVALRMAAQPAAVPDPPRRRRPILLALHTSDHGGRAWRLAPSSVV